MDPSTPCILAAANMEPCQLEGSSGCTLSLSLRSVLVFWRQQRSSRESPDPAAEEHALNIVQSRAQWKQDTADEDDLIGKDYAGTSPLWDRMCDLQCACHPER